MTPSRGSLPLHNRFLIIAGVRLPGMDFFISAMPVKNVAFAIKKRVLPLF